GVVFKPTATGAAAGTFTAVASTNTVTVALAGTGLRRISVYRPGGGSGRVTSTPPGIDCGTTCSGVFLRDVTLTAVADDGSVFAGWGQSCGPGDTCTLPASSGSRTITANFEQLATAEAINVTFDGDGIGEITLQNADTGNFITFCDGSCTTFVA